MDRLTLPGLVLVAGLLVGCAGDDDGATPTDDTTETTAGSDHTPTTEAPNTGDLDVPEIPGTFVAAVPSLGFGIAVPEGWQATVLSDEAIERLENATLSQPSFLDAARNVKASGAVFYAAGIDGDGRVAELKVDVQDGADSTPAGLASLAAAVADSGRVEDVNVVEDLEGGRVRVDYRLTGAGPDADEGDEPHGAIDTIGSQIFASDGDRVWSFIVTSEDQASQDALLDVFEASITF